MGYRPTAPGSGPYRSIDVLPDYRIRQRDVLLEIIRTITQELDPDRVLEKILRISVEILNGQAGIIALPGGGLSEAGSWRIAASVGVAPAFLKSLETILREIPQTDDPERLCCSRKSTAACSS